MKPIGDMGGVPPPAATPCWAVRPMGRSPSRSAERVDVKLTVYCLKNFNG